MPEDLQDDSDLITQQIETQKLSATERCGGESFVTLSYSETMFNELEMLPENKPLDGIVIDLSEVAMPLLDMMVKLGQQAERLLKVRGILVIVGLGGALTFSKDDPGKGLAYNFYSSPMDIFIRHPVITEHIVATVPSLDRRRLSRDGDSIANHILYSSIPVLSDTGKEIRDSATLSPHEQKFVQLIDDYRSVETIIKNAESRFRIATPDCLRMLQRFEAERMIFPIFSRVSFLFNCFKKRRGFRLGHYMVATNILSEAQLTQLLEHQAEMGRKNESLGALAVQAGYMNKRQLEVLLADQYIYGQRLADRDGEGAVDSEHVKDSIIGSLGSIDAAGLLQSLESSQKTGLLTIEEQNNSILISFQKGKISRSRMGKLCGKAALTELLVFWTAGIFLFRDEAGSLHLDESCALTNSLQKILLDSALAKDHVQGILNKLPAGSNTIVERVWNIEAGWQYLAGIELVLCDETPVTADGRKLLYRVAGHCDGLATVEDVLRQMDDIPGPLVVKSLGLLLDKRLLCIQQAGFFAPLAQFQTIITGVQAHLSEEDNYAILSKSLQHTFGESEIARMFKVNKQSAVGLNMEEIRKAGAPVSAVIGHLGRWTNAYTAYARRLLGAEVVEKITESVQNAGR